MDANMTEAMFIAQQQSDIVFSITTAIVALGFFWLMSKAS